MSAAEDAAALAKAFKGIGTDEAVVTGIITHRTPEQIEEIKHAYQAQFGKDLLKDIHSELSGNYLKVIDGILRGPVNYDAYELNKAIKGLGTDDHALVEILVGRTNQETDLIEKAYELHYSKPLSKDIADDTSGDFKAILLNLLEHRAKGEPSGASPWSVEADAEALFKAGEGKLGTDEKVFIDIFTHRPYPHLKAVFHHYENHHKHHSIVQAIDNEFSGHIKLTLKSIAQFVHNPGDYYAQLIHESTKGVGTNDAQLIRIVIGQRQHLSDIKTAFSTRYSRTLHNFVRDDTSGDYRAALLEVIGDN